MGKRKGGKSTYEHNHTHNPRKRESDERRLLQLRNMEVRRLQKAVEKQEAFMTAYIPEHLLKKPRLDPNYNLTGAARPAREFYKDPNFVEEPEAEDILTLHDANLWGHPEGQILLGKLYELGVGLHNVGNRSKEAVEVFQRMLRQDPQDNLLAKRALLRCYLDMGYGLQARQLVDEQFPDDSSACFSYARVMVEFVACFLLQEENCMESAVLVAMDKAVKANPYVLWPLVYHSTFSEAVEHLDELESALSGGSGVEQGGVLEALQYFHEDSSLWLETDGAVEWLKAYAESHPEQLPFPPLLPPVNPTLAATSAGHGAEEVASDAGAEVDADAGNSSMTAASDAEANAQSESDQEDDDEEGEGVEMSEEEIREMYLNMYQTAVDMVEAGL